MNLINLLDEAYHADIGLNIETTEPLRFREYLWKFIADLPIEYDHFKDCFVATTSPYDPHAVFLIKKSLLSDEILQQRGGLIEFPNFQGRGEAKMPQTPTTVKIGDEEIEIDLSTGESGGSDIPVGSDPGGSETK